MDVGGIGSPAFLDAIPEDASVAATQHAANLSSVSAVASSDCEEMDDPFVKTTSRMKKWKGKRRRGEGREPGATRVRVLDSDKSTGPRAVTSDNVSDANASLGGLNDHDVGEPFYMPPLMENSEDVATSKPFFASPECKKYSLIVLGIVSALVVAIGVGIFVILVKIPDREDANSEFSTPSSSPTTNLGFPPIGFNVAYPSSSKLSFSADDVNELDKAFLKVYGTTKENLYDSDTPQGKGRNWIINSDESIDLKKDVERRAQQRYILCVFHYATSGNFWNKSNNWMDAERSECEWYGVACDDKNLIIEEIDLSDNNITGPLPDEIGSLSSLKLLNMSFNLLSSTIPDNFFDVMEALKTLDLQKNKITGTIPQRTSSMSELTYLDLGHNKLKGDCPFFSNLEVIMVAWNNIESIDSQYYTSSPSLKMLQAYNNNLSGPLPTEWNTSDLIELDLGRNLLTGTIPQVLWNLPSLKRLFLDHCNLTGILPGFSENIKMQKLWLDSNSLVGSIPSNFGWNWTSLYSVKLQNNSLTGEINSAQCTRWEDPLSKNDSTGVEEEYSAAPIISATNNDSSEDKEWKFETDCEIDCACCTNTNCVTSSTDADNSINGR
uniref:Leucine-rich repeat-containing N-terminal plant-type domain-containing protein n=1 Tax=Pseudo-nitzschia australis TaxID=44445 RepID=A0A7S4AVN8_9STRA|mmetsp:Transcript_6923/g.14707  ORF Transcript_6923/g.14707 Transcript_6923/m.14707 type:complete len:608 (-) Transcript_6923:111-1934(-)